MVRWRFGLALAMLLLLPAKVGSKSTQEEEDEEESSKLNASRRGEDDDDDEDEDEDDDDDEQEKVAPGAGSGGGGGRIGQKSSANSSATAKALGLAITRTTKKRPLECFVCAYKSETPLRACLDPTKFKVHTITCHSVDDKCFTSAVSSSNDTYEAVVRGCRSDCVNNADTTCCELNRCNNQAYAVPLQPQASLAGNNKLSNRNTASKSDKFLAPNVLFFITILLLLQTVVKVAFV